jgi:uncharacterized protein (DUF58 family)
VRIPKTPIQTSWRADWLIEFGIALAALAFLTREIIFAVIGAGILLALARLGLLFLRRLGVLRGQLYVAARLPRARVMLGDSIEGDLTIQNESRLAARVLVVTPVVEKGLSLRLSSSSSQVLRPDTTSSSKFEITSLKSGRFQISGFALTFTDARGLFTGEVSYEQDDWVEVYPGVRTKVPITPLRLYGGSPEVFRKGPAGIDYAGVHQYAPGDEYHRVEWKATARLRTLMVKEFHPETQTTLQILIDAGRTMHEQSYVGTRLDEALAISQLLVESAMGSADRIGILVYEESRIVKAVKPERAEQQLASLRELALSLLPQAPREKTARQARAPFWNGEKGPPGVEPLATFIRLLRLKLGSSYRKTGMYKALEQATTANLDSVIILTDLLTDSEVLLRSASTGRERANIIVTQIGAPWRSYVSLEDAYPAYDRNSRILNRLQHVGLAVFDIRPEILVDKIGEALRVPRQCVYG